MKISFEQLTLEVEKLYQEPVLLEATAKDAEEHCDKIIALITACGWTEEEFWRATYDTKSISRKMN